MNLKVPGAILPLGYAILSTRAKTVWGLLQPPFGELSFILKSISIFGKKNVHPGGNFSHDNWDVEVE